MVRTVKQRYLEVNDLITGHYPTRHRFFDARFNCWDIFTRNRATNNPIDELKTLTTWQWLQGQFDVTILPFTTRLTNEFAVNVGRLRD